MRLSIAFGTSRWHSFCINDTTQTMPSCNRIPTQQFLSDLPKLNVCTKFGDFNDFSFYQSKKKELLKTCLEEHQMLFYPPKTYKHSALNYNLSDSFYTHKKSLINNPSLIEKSRICEYADV